MVGAVSVEEADSRRVPRFEDLPVLGDTGERHSWDVFGRDDVFGCLNFITPEAVVAASREIRAGRVVNLNMQVGEPQPQFWSARPRPRHTVETKRNTRDDSLDDFNTQGSTQIDGFGHHRFRQFGYFGGRQDEDVNEAGVLGIDAWADRGIVGRGVLADVASYLAFAGTPLDPAQRCPIGPELLDATLAHQGTECRPGDMLVIRTGWLEWYQDLPAQERESLAASWSADRSLASLPGISPGQDAAAWLWDRRVSLLALDNPTAETLPYVPAEGWAHHRVLVLLGVPLGELWDVRALSRACAEEQQWSFLLSVAPMNLPGGAASPANAYAVL
jgi:kynurenine formamidase